MSKRRNTIEWVIAAAAALGVAYLYHKATDVTPASSTSLTSPTDTAGGEVTPTPAILVPTGQITTAAVATSPIVTASTGGTELNGANLPTGISQAVYNKVMEWAHGDGRPPILTMAAALIPSEYNGMYDIITTQWATGAKPTLAQKTFWDDLRGKYDPTHKYW